MALFYQSLLRHFAGIVFVVVLVAAIDNSDPVTLKFLDLESEHYLLRGVIGSFLARATFIDVRSISAIGLRKQVRQTNKVNSI